MLTKKKKKKRGICFKNIFQLPFVCKYNLWAKGGFHHISYLLLPKQNAKYATARSVVVRSICFNFMNNNMMSIIYYRYYKYYYKYYKYYIIIILYYYN